VIIFLKLFIIVLNENKEICSSNKANTALDFDI